ncbi:hypothetical protein [Vibrio alfacsensis]|uniref:hypothetical protein n=1 Tax=Vibrio alfacsensis TaxID=1074311 RepID=UPI00406984D8
MIHHVLSAYYGEIYGIAFFNHYLNNYSRAKRDELWETLIKVEELTAQKLKPILTAIGMDIESRHKEMLDKGLADAEMWIALPWEELVSTLLTWIEPYEVKYRQWHEEVKVSEEHSMAERNAIELIADHETAIYHCWQQYSCGESGLPILNAFLAKYR